MTGGRFCQNVPIFGTDIQSEWTIISLETHKEPALYDIRSDRVKGLISNKTFENYLYSVLLICQRVAINQCHTNSEEDLLYLCDDVV